MKNTMSAVFALALAKANMTGRTAQPVTDRGLIAAGMTMTTTEPLTPDQIRGALKPRHEHQYEGF